MDDWRTDGAPGDRPQPPWDQANYRNSLDLEQEYLKTLKASTSQFSYSRYEDLLPAASKPPASNPLASSAPVTSPIRTSAAVATPAVSAASSSSSTSSLPTSSIPAPPPPSAQYHPRVPPEDYISTEERARLCAEDMRQVGMPRAAWYPTRTALFENLTPANTTALKTSAQPPSEPPMSPPPPPPPHPAAVSHYSPNYLDYPQNCPPVAAMQNGSHTEISPSAGVVTSVRKVGSWGTEGRNPIESFRNIPVRQFYDLTQLKRSNVRSNDELTPRPTAVDMGSHVIDRPFPAEHPYASHEPRLALFPKFTDCPDDPRTGVRARANVPKHAEIPSRAPDLRIISKTKGSGLHHVEQPVPLESEKLAMSWPGDRFEQLVKGDNRPKQTYYPTPPKLVQPNMEPRMPERSVSEVTADTLKNLERQQWLTHYTKQYTGLGPADPVQLTNFAEKQLQTIQEGVSKDDLKPRSTRTFDPPRPVEGRISRQIHPRPPMPPPPAPNPNRKPTQTEVEEDRMLNGKAYVSMPEQAFDRMVQDQQWRIMELGKSPEQNLERLAAVRASAPAQLTGTEREAEPNPIAQRKVTFKEQVQQMEAQDRWRVLEGEGPAEDVSQLRHKYSAMNQPSRESARVFFNHEGRFQEERAGLYRTSYDPQLLRHAMPSGSGENAAPLFDTSQSHEGAWYAPSPLNRAISLPNLGRSGNDLMMHQLQKENQRHILEPTVEEATVRVQEGGHLINRESEKGSQFNIDKFLQEYELPKYARSDPQRTFGRDGDLGTVQPHCVRLGSPNRVTFSNDVMVATGYGSEPIRLTSAALNDQDEGYHSGSAGEAATDGEGRRRLRGGGGVGGVGGRRMLLPEEARLVTHQQTSLASTFQGSGPQQYQTTFSSQFPAALPLTYKEDDPRFQWEAGHGTRWPQSQLLDLQHGFDRSAVRRRFHAQFHEQNPDLRENVTKGKKHEFSGVNSQVIRG